MSPIDHMFIINCLVILVSLYGVGLFAYDWHRQGAARPMFICVLVIFAGQIIDTGAMMYVRWAVQTTVANAASLPSNQWWYPFRMYPTLISYAFINFYLTGRMIYQEEHWWRDKAWKRKKLNGRPR